MAYKIKERRIEMGMSKAELCRRADVSRQRLTDLESGREVNVSVNTLLRIAEVLECSIRDLLTC